MKRERRRARGLAFQVLYEVDSVGHPLGEVLARTILENPGLSDEAIAFLQQLTQGAHTAAADLDRLIADTAPEWPVDELAVVDRNVLRLALYEFAVTGETPVRVAINEAVELAKRFGSDSSPRFVNGVLGTLAERHLGLSQGSASAPLDGG